MAKLKSRKIKPTTAIEYNNDSDKAALLIPYGGTPDNPEYLYPEELLPAVVTASLADSRKKQAKQQASTFRGRSLTGHIGGSRDLNMGDQSLLLIASKTIGVPLIIANPVTATVVPEVGGLYVKTYLNPVNAQTTAGALASTGANSYLIAKGLERNSLLIGNWFNGEFNHSDIPEFGLNFMGALPFVNTALNTTNRMYKVSANMNPQKPLTIKQWSQKYVKTNLDKIRRKLSKGLDYVKQAHNRYTAPRTNLNPEIFQGDLFNLMKTRLENGGFEKLGITPEDLVSIPNGHPLYISSQLNPNALSDFINARQFLLNSEPIPLTTEYSGIASYSPSSKTFTSPTKGLWGKIDANTKTITGHEFNHAIDDVVLLKSSKPSPIVSNHTYSPEMAALNLSKGPGSSWSKPPGYDGTKIPSRIDRYFRGKNGTELNARLAQIKNWYGITDPNQPITPEMWNYARRHYVNSVGADNNMQSMFMAVTDPEKFLAWINPRVMSYAGIVGLGSAGALNSLEDNELLK